ncbi:MAG: amidoligase family protein [Alphaproteobacteria bacterium]
MFISASDILLSMQWSTTIGVELEFLLPAKSFSRNILKDIWDIEKGWELQPEGLSTDLAWSGQELKSPIYDGDTLAKIEDITEYVRASGGIVNECCGLHIHAGLKPFPWQSWTDIQKQSFANYALIEPAMLYPYLRLHHPKLQRQSIVRAFDIGSMREARQMAQNILDGNAMFLKSLSRKTMTLYPQRDYKPYQTIEWKGPAGTLCPLQIAACMKFWDTLTGKSAAMALSSQGPHLPSFDEFKELCAIAQDYNSTMQLSESFDIDDRVRLLTWNADTLENYY